MTEEEKKVWRAEWLRKYRGRSSEEISINKKYSCPVCHDTGWELYQTTDTYDVYGENMEIEYARRCPKCKGIPTDLVDRTQVPEQYRGSDLYQFDFEAYKNDISKIKKVCFSFMNDFESWGANNKGLFIWSKTPGSGKTYLSCCLLKSVLLRTSIISKFITAVDYIATVGDSYKREHGDDPSKVYRECGLLVLDDIGAHMKGEWQQQELFRLINKRMEKGLITIYTSNSPIDGLNLDDRTKDRILKNTIAIHMPEESIRQTKAAAEQGEFLSRVVGI